MKIEKYGGSNGALSFKLLLTITLLYFFVVFPWVHFFLPGHVWTPQYGYSVYFAGVFAYVLGIKNIPLAELGFSRQHLKKHLCIGLILGGLVVASLPLLDALIAFSGLDQNELFSEAANQRNADDWKGLNPRDLSARVLIFPLLTQFFFTGLIFQGLDKKYDPVLALFAGAIIFTLGHFKLNLGLFILGIITAYLHRLTGTLYASILFHMGCALAGILLLYTYPRLITLVVFLF